MKKGKKESLAPRVSGFTMVELVLVIVLTGILAAVALPRFAGTSAFLERGYYDELIQATRYAQKLALASHCQARIRITSNDYTVGRPDDQTDCPSDRTPTWTPALRPDASGAFSASAPDGVAVVLAGDPLDIVFHPDGTADSSPNVGVGNRSFQVWQATGYVERQ